MSKVKSWLNNWCKLTQRGSADNLEYNDSRLFDEFSLLALNRFKWENLPEGIESRHIERGLFKNGQVAFFKDDLKGLLCLPCSASSNLNVYGDATKYNAVGIGYNQQVDINDMVRIMTNDNATPTVLKVLYYSSLVDEVERTGYMNLKLQRIPWIIGTTKETELTLRAIMQKIDNFEEHIFVDTKFSSGGDIGTKAIDTNAPYLLDKLRAEKNEVINEYLSWLGLNNTQNDKKERMLVDEINVNNNYILMNLDIEYKHRQKACEEINKKFGLDIKVIKTIDELEVDFMGQQLDNDDDGIEEVKKRGLFR